MFQGNFTQRHLFLIWTKPFYKLSVALVTTKSLKPGCLDGIYVGMSCSLPPSHPLPSSSVKAGLGAGVQPHVGPKSSPIKSPKAVTKVWARRVLLLFLGQLSTRFIASEPLKRAKVIVLVCSSGSQTLSCIRIIWRTC